MKPADRHQTWMWEAIAEAQKAALAGEVPIGAVAIFQDELIGKAHNMREKTHNPLGHAELLLLQKISKQLQSWRLEEITLYVTCEPCLMCAGAILQARIPNVVYGCPDPKAGALGSLYDISQDPRLNHRIEVVRGVLQEECGQLLRHFFQSLRKKL